MSDWSNSKESPEAIGAVDALLASVGLVHGKRTSRAGTWKNGQRIHHPKTTSNHTFTTKKTTRKAGPGLLRPVGWERYLWLNAGFSTREGGVSTLYGPGDQNLGYTPADPVENVRLNRQRFLRAIAGPHPGELITLRQQHTAIIRLIDQTPPPSPPLRGDGLMTAQRGFLLGIVTADCVPVLVADTRHHAVAAFHAGWRGTLARIVERGIGSMRLHFGSRPSDLIAAIGPAIGPCCFAVGEEVRFEFESQFGYANSLFSEVYDSDPVRERYPLLFLTARAPGHSNLGPQIHLDLIEANRRQLLDAGVPADKITITGECTACTRLPNGRLKYFSHRGEHGFTGRMLSVIGVAQPR
ncbi:MAG TPA: peptidoglycan editing factor PgeF [Acidobacteriaceae bacterium]|nr:peptidoglycan editing factor PgeF [Acidobacteriaceae bacterium]